MSKAMGFEKIQGIVLKTTPFKERDMIVRLLLRNGQKVSMLVYGGQGGGKKGKPRLLEPGYSLEVVLKKTSVNTDLLTCKEFDVVWAHQSLRHDFQAFSILCFYLELMDKSSEEADSSELNSSSFNEGAYRCLANGVFFLDQAIKEKYKRPMDLLFIFLVKLMFEQGIAPDFSSCSHCQEALKGLQYIFSVEGEGFVCESCLNLNTLSFSQSEFEHGSRLLSHLAQIWALPFQEYMKVDQVDYFEIRQILDFLSIHLQIDLRSLSTLKLLKVD